jgi:cobalt-zinc-cadmium efflux system protein
MGLHHHDHHHGHHHHHHHDHQAHSRTSNIKLALVLNLTFALVELVGGYWAQSMAVTADALHDFGDALSLGMALLLERLAMRRSDAKFSYGYRRLSLLSAAVTSAVLIVGTAFILEETIERFSKPMQPHGLGMMGLAVLGVAVNGFAAMRLQRGKSMNEKVLSWHMLEDLFGWVLVLAAGAAIHFFELAIVDPILSVLFSCFILYGVFRAFRETMGLFLQAVPTNLPIADIERDLQAVEGLRSVHDFHVWSLDGERHVATLHAVVDSGADLTQTEAVKQKIREVLSSFGNFHATIEVESNSVNCADINCVEPLKPRNQTPIV